VAALPVAAVDTVGAGDAFVAGYLAESLRGRPPADRLRTAAAWRSPSAPRATGGLPTRDDLDLLAASEGTVLR
jgi:2-dehydro-3-deoxygluconokinase